MVDVVITAVQPDRVSEELAPRSDWPNDCLDHGVAVDALGDRLADEEVRQPGVILVEAEIFPHRAKARHRVDLADTGDLFQQGHIGLRVDHVGLPIPEGIYLDLLVAEKQDVQGLHITGCLTPVVGIPPQGDPLLRHPFDESERTRAHCDGIVPDGVERFALEDVRRQNRAEQRLPRRIDLVEGEDDRLVIDDLIPGDQVVTLPTGDVQRRVGDGLVGKDEVGGGHWSSIGPGRLLTNVVPDAECVAAFANHRGCRSGRRRGLRRRPGRGHRQRGRWLCLTVARHRQHHQGDEKRRTCRTGPSHVACSDSCPESSITA